MTSKPNIRILQYNVMKSKDKVMATLLRDERIKEFDILAIQEPWRNPYISTTHHPAQKIYFTYVTPKMTNTAPPVFASL